MKLTHYLRTEQHYRNAPIGTQVAMINMSGFFERVAEDKEGRSWAEYWAGRPRHRPIAMSGPNGDRRRIVRWGRGPTETADLLAGLDADQQEHAPQRAVLDAATGR